MKEITVTGRRWFQRTYGNTYHVVDVWIDDEFIFTSPMEYGYDEQYLETAFAGLEERGLIKRERQPHGGKTAPWRWCEENGIVLHKNVYDVRKRDLRPGK